MNRLLSILSFVLGVVFSTSCLTKAEVDYSPWYNDGGNGSDTPVDPVVLGDSTFAVMSFNLRNYASDQGTANSWDKRRKGVYAMLKAKQPMIIGTQEGYITQLSDIKKNCTAYDYYGVGRDNGASNGETTAIFYIKDSVIVVEYGTFWLSETPSKPSIGWDAYCRRTCTWMQFKMKSNGKEFIVFNTHLDHKGQTARSEGMKLIYSKMKAINTKNLPVFLTGDFNSGQDDTALEGNPLASARSDSPIRDNYNTTNGYGSGSANQIDHIFYSGVKPLSFETIRDRWDGVTYISDHYPVMATFKYLAD